MDAAEQARDRWREHTLGCPRCGFDRMCPTGEALDARFKLAARAGYEARRNAGPVAAYQRLFVAYQAPAQDAQPGPHVTPDEPQQPATGWTDDEWLAAMAQFPPAAPIAVVERWIAERRG